MSARIAASPIYIVKELERLLANRLCFVFRNFPLTSIHPHAEHAAEAAEAVGAQGEFWGMHDCLFEHQDALDDIHLIRYGAMLGLDLPRFSGELREHRYAARMREDFHSGMRSGVNATPTFFINGCAMTALTISAHCWTPSKTRSQLR